MHILRKGEYDFDGMPGAEIHLKGNLFKIKYRIICGCLFVILYNHG